MKGKNGKDLESEREGLGEKGKELEGKGRHLSLPSIHFEESAVSPLTTHTLMYQACTNEPWGFLSPALSSREGMGSERNLKQQARTPTHPANIYLPPVLTQDRSSSPPQTHSHTLKCQACATEPWECLSKQQGREGEGTWSSREGKGAHTASIPPPHTHTQKTDQTLLLPFSHSYAHTEAPGLCHGALEMPLTHSRERKGAQSCREGERKELPKQSCPSRLWGEVRK